MEVNVDIETSLRHCSVTLFGKLGILHDANTVAKIPQRYPGTHCQCACIISFMGHIFFTESMGFDLNNTGFLSGLPYLVMGILLGIAGYFADWFQVKGYLTTTQVRRYFNCLAFLAQTVFMVLVAIVLDPVYSVLFVTIAVGLGAFAWCGFA